MQSRHRELGLIALRQSCSHDRSRRANRVAHHEGARHVVRSQSRARHDRRIDRLALTATLVAQGRAGRRRADGRAGLQEHQGAQGHARQSVESIDAPHQGRPWRRLSVLSHRARVGEGRQAAQGGGDPDDLDGDGHQQDTVRRQAGGDLLHLSQRTSGACRHAGLPGARAGGSGEAGVAGGRSDSDQVRAGARRRAGHSEGDQPRDHRDAVHSHGTRRHHADAGDGRAIPEGAERQRHHLPDADLRDLTGLRRHDGVVAGSSGPRHRRRRAGCSAREADGGFLRAAQPEAGVRADERSRASRA